MTIKSEKNKISENKKMLFFLMSQGSLNPNIRFLGQKLCSVATETTACKPIEHCIYKIGIIIVSYLFT